MKKGYCNGSDMLLYVDDEAIGHCTSHKSTFTTQTESVAVKPPAEAKISSSLWEEKVVNGLSYTVTTEGLVFYGETAAGYARLLRAWKSGKTVKLKCMERENDDKPYLKGDCVIDSLERNDAAKEKSTYSASFSNSGEPEILDETALTEEVSPAPANDQ